MTGARVVDISDLCFCPSSEMNLVGSPLRLLTHFYLCPLIDWWEEIVNCVGSCEMVLTIVNVFV